MFPIAACINLDHLDPQFRNNCRFFFLFIECHFQFWGHVIDCRKCIFKYQTNWVVEAPQFSRFWGVSQEYNYTCIHLRTVDQMAKRTAMEKRLRFCFPMFRARTYSGIKCPWVLASLAFSFSVHKHVSPMNCAMFMSSVRPVLRKCASHNRWNHQEAHVRNTFQSVNNSHCVVQLSSDSRV